MSSTNGESADKGPLELREVLHVETKDGASLPFEVVGVLEDPDDGSSYAVLMHEPEGADDDEDREFIVTDMQGGLLEDEALAQEILDEFLMFAEEAADAEGSEN
ncbi:MAG TPA: hypothetical protein VMS32_01835 [Verrucomicrobiae bacterium]|jgi:uncharacterized protein YrzB (UPF0473 family)|nr:hypothetical protein [Verrucomicrobiae bacterium]